MNYVREKILLLLLGGLAFGYSLTPQRQWSVLKTISREWNKLDKKELRRGIDYLYRLDFVEKEVKNNIVNIIPTKKGRLRILNMRLENIKNKKGKWDGKWRMVAFDIPEKHRSGRDVLRNKLKKIGFCELQKSILLTPYDCEKEIKELVDYFKLDKYVRFGVLESVDNENYFKNVFRLT